MADSTRHESIELLESDDRSQRPRCRAIGVRGDRSARSIDDGRRLAAGAAPPVHLRWRSAVASSSRTGGTTLTGVELRQGYGLTEAGPGLPVQPRRRDRTGAARSASPSLAFACRSAPMTATPSCRPATGRDLRRRA